MRTRAFVRSSSTRAARTPGRDPTGSATRTGRRRRSPALSDWGTETGAIEVGVCSTGLIGTGYRWTVLAGVTAIVHEMAALIGGAEAAQAIMTTDTVPKQVALHHGDNWTVGGWSRAGMFAPSLATMLCVITTDAAVDADALDHALRNASARTFDRIDIDGSCSTNDTVFCWRRVPARSRRARTSWTPPCSPCATTSVHNCRPTPRASPSVSW
jgi:glutamate N-acetyltransferase/amino-acid N-acetyltransferase